jgi:hypothetical protein
MTTCSESGIFYDLEFEEVIQEKNNLNNSAVFSTMFKIGNYYFGNAGANVFYRSDSSSSSADDWSKLKLPDGYADDIAVTSMVNIGTSIYLSVISHDGDSVESGIYRADASNPDDIKSGDWIEEVKKSESKTGVHNSHVYYLFAVANELYVNYVTYEYSNEVDLTGDIKTSTLFTGSAPIEIADDLSSLTEITLTSVTDSDGNDIPAKVENIVGSGTDPNDNYWIIMNGETEGNLYFSADDPAGFSNALSGTPGSVRFVDIYAIDDALEDDRILLSDTAGKLHIYDQNAGTFVSLEQDGAWFNGFYSIDGLDAGSISNQIIVGTMGYVGESTYDGEGYYQLDVSDSDYNNWDWVSGNFSDDNNYTSSDLADSSINGFYYDSSQDRLFAYTQNSGVWVNEEEDSKRIWARE